MENEKKYECTHCMQQFGRKRHLSTHIKDRPLICFDIEKRLKIYKERIIAEMKKEFEIERSKSDKTHEKVVDQLVHTKVDVRTRKKVVEDVIAQKKIPSFQSVLDNAHKEYTLEQLKNYIRLDGEGDVIIFKELFIDKPEPDERCIRVCDHARDKYEIYDGNQWVTIKLRDIVDIIMDKFADLYYPVIAEKRRMLDEVDKKYPRYSGKESIIEMNTQVYNEVSDMFRSATEHRAGLLSKTEELNSEIRRGIQGLLVKLKK